MRASKCLAERQLAESGDHSTKVISKSNLPQVEPEAIEKQQSSKEEEKIIENNPNSVSIDVDKIMGELDLAPLPHMQLLNEHPKHRE